MFTRALDFDCCPFKDCTEAFNFVHLTQHCEKRLRGVNDTADSDSTLRMTKPSLDSDCE